MLGTHSTKIAAVGGDQGSQFQPFGNGNQRRVNQTQKVVLGDQFRASGEIGLMEMLHHNFSGGQRLREIAFDVWTEATSDQIGRFWNYRAWSKQ